MRRQAAKKKTRKSIKKRLAAYSVAAAATVTGAAERSANADTIHFNIPDVTIGPLAANNSGGAINVDVDAGVVGTGTNPLGGATDLQLKLLHRTNGDRRAVALVPFGQLFVENETVNTTGGGSVSYGSFFVNVPSTQLFPPATYAPGQTFKTVFANLQRTYGNFTAPLGNFPPGTRGNIGFLFDIGVDQHAGWAEISYAVNGLDEPSLTLHGFGYNDVSGAPVHPVSSASANVVPEPSSALAWLACGVVGLAAWRLRKRAARR